jgi:hypothetical protein
LEVKILEVKSIWYDLLWYFDVLLKSCSNVQI